MKFDIVFVTYNSEKWIDNCINSILKSDYNLKNISLIFYDNNSSDNTVSSLYGIKEEYENKFNSIQILESKSNKGFGYGNNQGAKVGSSKYIFFLNIDTEINKDTLKRLEEEINNSDSSFAMWELAQRPYEHPKYYDPVTQETSWSSGACMIVKRDVFEKIGGFDKNIFMYCEDVEISWNLRKHGYKIKYLYNVPITHYSYEKPNEFKYTQFVYGFISNWYIRAKYGNLKRFVGGIIYMLRVILRGQYIPDSIERKVKKKIRKEMLFSLIRHSVRNTWIFLKTKKGKFEPIFYKGFDYEVPKENAFYIQPEMKSKPLVSIIVRTCNRKEALRENLISLRKQTYKNIEIVVVEDGKNTAEDMIKKEFSDLNIVYEATKENIGRSKVANIAMKKAKGKYLNFLDDDDVFFPDHVETLVKVIENNQYDIVYDGAFETQIIVNDKKDYSYTVKSKELFKAKTFNRRELYKINLFPIQTVMFKKSLFEECGGIDENIDALEDWDFWVRLSLEHEFHKVDATTSIFRTPFSSTEKEKRNSFLRESSDYLEEKFKTYKPQLTVYDYFKE